MPRLISRRDFTLGVAAAAALSAPSVARAVPRVVRLGHNSVSTSQYGQGCIALADAVARHADLAGILEIEVHGNAEFGDEAPMLADARAGALDMVACASFSAAPFCPEIGLLDPPFLFHGAEQGRSAIDGALGQEYSDLLKSAGINVVAWLENGVRHFTSSRPIRHPADLIGLKLRTPPNPVSTDCFRGLGADARPLAFKLLPEALRTGQFEAQENPIAAAEAIKLYEVQKYLCLTSHSYSVGMLVASADLIEELGPKYYAILQVCAAAATQRSRAVAAAGDRDGVERLRQKGMTIVDDVDTAAFVIAAQVNFDLLCQRFGRERVQRLIKTLG
jgi:tripartite ATP-independent transporter DctP family solute receptor